MLCSCCLHSIINGLFDFRLFVYIYGYLLSLCTPRVVCVKQQRKLHLLCRIRLFRVPHVVHECDPREALVEVLFAAQCCCEALLLCGILGRCTPVAVGHLDAELISGNCFHNLSVKLCDIAFGRKRLIRLETTRGYFPSGEPVGR